MAQAPDPPLVLPSAYRHRLSDDDILHAYALGQPAVVQDEDDMLMIIGPNRSGTELLEVGVITWHGMDAIAHAMPARPKFFFPQYRW